MNIELKEGSYKSIKTLKWNDIPELAIVTGKNGSGKTQLLELLNFHFGTNQQTKNNVIKQPGNPFYGVKLECNDFNVTDREVVYLPSIWQLGNLGSTNASQFTQVINKLHNHLTQNKIEQNYNELASIIETRIGKPRNLINRNDIQENLPIDYFDYINKIQIHEGLSEVFVSYHCKYAELRDENKNDEEIKSIIGDAPWDIINDLLTSADFLYKVNKPKTYIGDYHFQLINRNDDNIVVNFSDLSAGEKVLISLGIWMFNANKSKRLPKLLLLDEPDAHLHPTAIKNFIEVVENVLVKKHGVRVILTTHSPSTVAMSPDYSLFEMSNSAPQISPLSSKDYGINLLTEGLIVVKSNIKYVLVEDKNDALFYNEVFKILKSQNKIKDGVDVVFISASNKRNGTSGGCTVVRAWVEKFVNEGADDVFQGLMDKDNGTNIPENITTSNNLHVVDRYSLENYLLDPVLVFASLLHEKSTLSIDDIELTEQRDEHKVSKLPNDKLQKIVDFVLSEIEPMVLGLTESDKELIEVPFINERKLKYPVWFLNKRGHNLFGYFKSKYRSAVNYDRLVDSMVRHEWIPEDLMETIKTIQE